MEQDSLWTPSSKEVHNGIWVKLILTTWVETQFPKKKSAKVECRILCQLCNVINIWEMFNMVKYLVFDGSYFFIYWWLLSCILLRAVSVWLYLTVLVPVFHDHRYPASPCPYSNFSFVQFLSLSRANSFYPASTHKLPGFGMVLSWWTLYLVVLEWTLSPSLSLQTHSDVPPDIWLTLQILGDGRVPGFWPAGFGPWHTTYSLSTLPDWLEVSPPLPLFSHSW